MLSFLKATSVLNFVSCEGKFSASKNNRKHIYIRTQTFHIFSDLAAEATLENRVNAFVLTLISSHIA